MKNFILIFDWDGTICDSFEAGKDAMIELLNSQGFRLNNEIYMRLYSPNWQVYYEYFRIPNDKWPELDSLWLKYYKKRHKKLFSDALYVKKIANYSTVGLITSGYRDRVEKEIKDMGFEDVFHFSVYGDDVKNKKPDPESILYALRKIHSPNMLNINLKKTCFYIGDSLDDIKMALNANINAIFVNRSNSIGNNIPDYCKHVKSLYEIDKIVYGGVI